LNTILVLINNKLTGRDIIKTLELDRYSSTFACPDKKKG
jgi:hypothetical protein